MFGTVILRAATQEFLGQGLPPDEDQDDHQEGRCLTAGLLRLFPEQEPTLAESFGVMWSGPEHRPGQGRWRQRTGRATAVRISANPPALAFQRDVLALAHSSPEDEAEDRRWPARVGRGRQEHYRRSGEYSRPRSRSTARVAGVAGYSLIGALHEATFRAEWGDEFDKTDVMRVHLWLWLAALAALRGETDIEHDWRATRLIQQLADAESQVPPPIDEWPEPPLPYRIAADEPLESRMRKGGGASAPPPLGGLTSSVTPVAQATPRMVLAVPRPRWRPRRSRRRRSRRPRRAWSARRRS